MTGMTKMDDQCPMAVPGTMVQATEMADGMTLTFTTAGDASDLRRRVHSMADRMNAASSPGSGGMGMHDVMVAGADGGSHVVMGGGMGGPGMSGMMTSDGGHATMGGMMPPVRAQAEDVESGARVRVTSLDPSRMSELRQRMQQHARMMNETHGCPMPGESR
jgi:hypothetical protein